MGTREIGEMDDGMRATLRQEALVRGPDQQYMLEMKHELLTAREEIALGRRIQGEDAADALKARNELVCRNLRLVVSMAQKYRHYMPYGDLIQEGNIGLMEAAEKFDPDRGCRFSTYATSWIQQGMLNALSEDVSVFLPDDVRLNIKRIARLNTMALEEIGRELSPRELAEKLRISLGVRRIAELNAKALKEIGRELSSGELTEKITVDFGREKISKFNTKALKEIGREFSLEELVGYKGSMREDRISELLRGVYAVSAVSLDEPLAHDTDRTRYDLIEDPEEDRCIGQDIEAVDMVEKLLNLLMEDTRLPEKKRPVLREIIVRAFGLEGREQQSLPEIAKDIGINTDRVSSLLTLATRWLRNHGDCLRTANSN